MPARARNETPPGTGTRITLTGALVCVHFAAAAAHGGSGVPVRRALHAFFACEFHFKSIQFNSSQVFFFFFMYYTYIRMYQTIYSTSCGGVRCFDVYTAVVVEIFLRWVTIFTETWSSADNNIFHAVHSLVCLLFVGVTCAIQAPGPGIEENVDVCTHTTTNACESIGEQRRRSPVIPLLFLPRLRRVPIAWPHMPAASGRRFLVPFSSGWVYRSTAVPVMTLFCPVL